MTVSSTVLQMLSVDYMHFLEECRKSEDEAKAGQAKAAARVKAKLKQWHNITPPPPRKTELTKQLKYQQHQIGTLVGQMKKFSFTCWSYTTLL